MRSAVDPRISVVVLTHNRRDELLGTLARLTALPARRPIIVVDNDSSDGTREAIVRRFPEVALLHAGGNLGAAGRNLGIHAARTPYVALADDDTWWTEPALRRGAELLDAHARLAVVTAQVLVGVDAHADPACAVMATSPLAPDATLPGPRLLGFLAGASMVRRQAVLDVGGFEPRLFLGSEEVLLGADLAAAGWSAVYAGDVVVHHHPSRLRDSPLRRRLIARNDLWFAWRRLPLGIAITATLAALWRSARHREARAALVAALAGLPWALATRRRLPERVLDDWRRLRR